MIHLPKKALIYLYQFIDAIEDRMTMREAMKPIFPEGYAPKCGGRLPKIPDDFRVHTFKDSSGVSGIGFTSDEWGLHCRRIAYIWYRFNDGTEYGVYVPDARAAVWKGQWTKINRPS